MYLLDSNQLKYQQRLLQSLNNKDQSLLKTLVSTNPFALNALTDTTDIFGRSIIFFIRDIHLLKSMLDTKKFENLFSLIDARGFSAIHNFIDVKNVDALQVFLNHFHHKLSDRMKATSNNIHKHANEDQNATILEFANAEGLTPLLMASKHGQLRTVTLLTQFGANLLAVNPRNSDNCLHMAVVSQNRELVEFLITKGILQNSSNRVD